MAAKKETAGKAAKKSKAGTRAKKPAAKPASKKTAKAKKPASKDATTGLDKSVEHFLDSLERSVTLSRDRLQEVVDDAVNCGFMNPATTEKMLSELVKKGR